MSHLTHDLGGSLGCLHASDHLSNPVVSTFLKQTKIDKSAPATAHATASLDPQLQDFLEELQQEDALDEKSRFRVTLQVKSNGIPGMLARWKAQLVTLNTTESTVGFSEGLGHAPFQVICLDQEGMLVAFDKASHEVTISEHGILIVRLKAARLRVTDDWFKRARVCAHASAIRNSSGKLTTPKHSSSFSGSLLNDSLSSIPDVNIEQ